LRNPQGLFWYSEPQLSWFFFTPAARAGALNPSCRLLLSHFLHVPDLLAQILHCEQYMYRTVPGACFGQRSGSIVPSPARLTRHRPLRGQSAWPVDCPISLSPSLSPLRDFIHVFWSATSKVQNFVVMRTTPYIVMRSAARMTARYLTLRLLLARLEAPRATKAQRWQ
jgi:hypothetical protein